MCSMNSGDSGSGEDWVMNGADAKRSSEDITARMRPKGLALSRKVARNLQAFWELREQC